MDLLRACFTVIMTFLFEFYFLYIYIKSTNIFCCLVTNTYGPLYTAVCVKVSESLKMNIEFNL